MTDDASTLTLQQAAAISMREYSVGLSAGAGCGKTFVLTRRFLSHLEPGPHQTELSKLVAITFTDRAASEMRGRIREECHRRLQICPSDEVPHWLDIVRDLETARISTIHGFCASLLRTHAVEAAVDPGFTSLDQNASNAVLRHAVNESLLTQLEQGDEDAKAFVLQHGLERARTILERFVTLRFRVDFEHWSQVTVEECLDNWTAQANEELREALTELRRTPEARDALRLMTEYCPSDHKWLGPRRTILLDALPEDASTENPAAMLQAIAKNATLSYATSPKIWPSPEIHQRVRETLKALKDLAGAGASIKFGDEDDLQQAATCGLLALRVARYAVAGYERQKQQAGALDFDDLLLRARNLLRDSPRVRRSAAAGISLLMVDEFQDTDPIQAEIVEALCGDRLINGNLFLVGDKKQSIYRFRRADPAVFTDLRNKLHKDAQLPLSMNFRSQPAILDFVNALFADELGDDYEALIPHVEQLSPSPSVEFLWATPAEGEDGPVKTAKDERRRIEADWIARRLHQLLHDGVPRIRTKNPETGQAELRPVEPGDICILLRAMPDVRYYEQALREYGLAYYLVGGRAFYAQQEVYDIANLCQFLGDPDDNVSLLGILRSPFFGLRDDTLFAMVQNSGTLSAALAAAPPENIDEKQQEQVRNASRVLAELRREKDRMPLHHLLSLALERTGYDAALLAEFMGRRKLANLRKLVEMARQHERTGLLTMADFVQRLQQAVAEEEQEELAATHPETSDVIRIMTIHKSKGLEFPVVVVADMDRGAESRLDTVEFDSQLGPLVSVPAKFGRKFEHLGKNLFKAEESRQDDAERKRLLYVALTRAADHLILSANLEAIDKLSSPWMKIVAKYFDLETGKPSLDEETGAAIIPADYLLAVPEVAVCTSQPALPNIKKESLTGLLPLNQLDDDLAQAEAMTLPDSLRRFAPNSSERRQFSVSELEQIDAQLHSRPTAMLDEVRRPDDDEPPMTADAATILGTLVHAALEQVNFQDFGDVAALVEECSLTLADGATEEIRQRAAEMIRGFEQSPLGRELSTARRVFRELEFQWRCSSEGDTPLRYIAGFIDCLYESSDGTWTIVDYKTGRTTHHGDEAAQLAAYELQLGTYALAARQLLGRLPDRVELVLLADDCRRLSLEVTEDRLTAIQQRLRAAMAVMINGAAAH